MNISVGYRVLDWFEHTDVISSDHESIKLSIVTI